MSRRTLSLLAALVLVACDDGDGATQATPDTTVADATVDMAPLDMAPPDMDPPDMAPPEGPLLARVYALDPDTDDGELTLVTLAQPTHPEGALTNEVTEVFNCLNREGGLGTEPGEFVGPVIMCLEQQTVRPEADGNYLHITPPGDLADPEDGFAEVMAYHHINGARAYFDAVAGASVLDAPLLALVNVQFQLRVPLPEQELDAGEWWGFRNAAYLPTWEGFAQGFGLPPREEEPPGGLLLFGQSEGIDFAYDTSVIFHEFTHAVIGSERLQRHGVADAHGLDLSPRALNEGLADYFAASAVGATVIGGYIAPGFDRSARDVAEPRRCPDDIVGREHADGRIIGSALWLAREALGADVLDPIVYAALEQATGATTLPIMGELLVAEAAEVGPEVEAALRPILEAAGVVGCTRARPWLPFEATDETALQIGQPRGPVDVFVEHALGTPAPVQLTVSLPEGAAAIRLAWRAGELPPEVDVTLAARMGRPVTLEYGDELSIQADRLVRPVRFRGRQELVVDASCFDGDEPLYTLFFSLASGRLEHLDIEPLEAVPGPEEGFEIMRCGCSRLCELEVEGNSLDGGCVGDELDAWDIDLCPDEHFREGGNGFVSVGACFACLTQLGVPPAECAAAIQVCRDP